MDYKIALLPLFLLTMCAPAPVTSCSPRLDGKPTYCPPFDDVKLPRQQVRGEIDVWSPYHLHSLQMMFIRNAQIEKIERDMTQPSDAINNALVDFWEKQDGSNDPSK